MPFLDQRLKSAAAILEVLEHVEALVGGAEEDDAAGFRQARGELDRVFEVGCALEPRMPRQLFREQLGGCAHQHHRVDVVHPVGQPPAHLEAPAVAARANSIALALRSLYRSKVPWRSRWSGVMLRITPTWKRGLSTDSSWKLDSSSTTQCRGVTSCSRSRTVSPMLPPTRTGRSPAARTVPVSAVVVVLPLVPVMPTTVPGQRRKNRSFALEHLMPYRRASFKSWASHATPRLASA